MFRERQCKMWKLHSSDKDSSESLSISLLIFFVLCSGVAGGLSDKRLCADPKCQKTISMGIAKINYQAGEAGMVSFKINSIIHVKSKSAGNNLRLWGIEVNGRQGYAPKDFIQETKVLINSKSLGYEVPVVMPGETIPTDAGLPLLNASESAELKVDTEATVTTSPLNINDMGADVPPILTGQEGLETTTSATPSQVSPVQPLIEIIDGTQIPVLNDEPKKRVKATEPSHIKDEKNANDLLNEVDARVEHTEEQELLPKIDDDIDDEKDDDGGERDDEEDNDDVDASAELGDIPKVKVPDTATPPIIGLIPTKNEKLPVVEPETFEADSAEIFEPLSALDSNIEQASVKAKSEVTINDKEAVQESTPPILEVINDKVQAVEIDKSESQPKAVEAVEASNKNFVEGNIEEELSVDDKDNEMESTEVTGKVSSKPEIGKDTKHETINVVPTETIVEPSLDEDLENKTNDGGNIENGENLDNAIESQNGFAGETLNETQTTEDALPLTSTDLKQETEPLQPVSVKESIKVDTKATTEAETDAAVEIKTDTVEPTTPEIQVPELVPELKTETISTATPLSAAQINNSKETASMQDKVGGGLPELQQSPTAVEDNSQFVNPNEYYKQREQQPEYTPLQQEVTPAPATPPVLPLFGMEKVHNTESHVHVEGGHGHHDGENHMHGHSQDQIQQLTEGLSQDQNHDEGHSHYQHQHHGEDHTHDSQDIDGHTHDQYHTEVHTHDQHHSEDHLHSQHQDHIHDQHHSEDHLNSQHQDHTHDQHHTEGHAHDQHHTEGHAHDQHHNQKEDLTLNQHHDESHTKPPAPTGWGSVGSMTPNVPQEAMPHQHQPVDPMALPSTVPPHDHTDDIKEEGLFATILGTVNSLLSRGNKKTTSNTYQSGENDNNNIEDGDDELQRILFPERQKRSKVNEKNEISDNQYCEKLSDGHCPPSYAGRTSQSISEKCEFSFSNLTLDNFMQILAGKVLEMSELLACLAIAAASTLFFIFGYYCFCNSSREGALLSKLNILERSLLAAHKENAILRDDLTKTRCKLSKIEDNSFGSNDMVMSLKSELEEEMLTKAKLQEQVNSLEKELENAAEAGLELNKIVSDLLSNQTGDESIISSVEELQRQLNEQQNTILEINANLAEKSRENSELQLMLAEQNARFGGEIASLQQDNDELEAEKGNLQTRLDEVKNEFEEDITKALEGKNAEIKRLQNEIVDLKTKWENEHSKWQTSTAKIEALEECLKTVKRDPNVNISKVIDLANIRAELLDVQKKRNSLKERLDAETDAHRLSHSQLQMALSEVEKLKQDFNQSEKDKLEAQTRLEVLANYFKEKETQLQKELSLKEAMWLKQQGETTSTVDRLTTMQDEIQSLKSQNDALRAEIEAQLAAHKAQIGTLENRAHETWLAARQSERRYEEARAEATALRHKLTAFAGGSANDSNHINADGKLNSELNNAPSPNLMESPGSPLLGRLPPPQFLPLPFMPPPPPPPFMGMPLPPFGPGGGAPPPPLGRLMSPPPPAGVAHGRHMRYSPDRGDYDDYEDDDDYVEEEEEELVQRRRRSGGDNSWHRDSYSPPPRAYRSHSPTDYEYNTERDLVSIYDTETDFSPPPSPRSRRGFDSRASYNAYSPKPNASSSNNERNGNYNNNHNTNSNNNNNNNNKNKSSATNKSILSSGSEKSNNSSRKKGGGKSMV